MRYAQIRSLDISNGEGIGVALFVQGCHFHCKECFNQETWDFDGGKEWTVATKEDFLKLANKDQIKRISILGGEPLSCENVDTVYETINEIHVRFGNSKKVWLYTGYSWTDVMNNGLSMQKLVLSSVDVVVDGRFEADKKDFRLKWRGSSNQRVIDVKKTLQQGEVVLWQPKD